MKRDPEIGKPVEKEAEEEGGEKNFPHDNSKPLLKSPPCVKEGMGAVSLFQHDQHDSNETKKDAEEMLERDWFFEDEITSQARDDEKKGDGDGKGEIYSEFGNDEHPGEKSHEV